MVRFLADQPIAELEIRDFLGRNISSVKFAQSTQGDLDLSALSPGIYLLRAIATDGTWQSTLWQKQ